MQVLVIVHASAASEADAMPPGFQAEMMAAMDRFNDQLREAGLLVMAHGLTPTAQGARIRIDGASRTVIPGPFSPPEAQIAGFWIWTVESLDQALEWASRCPAPMPTPSTIEVRPLH
jgi:hypothetical protein